MSQTFARLRSLCPTVSVGTLTADLMDLGSELALLERAGVGIVHVDVMDGCFCPMLTVGPSYVKGLRTPLIKDVHLMIREPLDKLESYAKAGADILTVHVEAAVHIHRVLQRLGTLENANRPGEGIVRGVAFDPGTPLEWLEPLVDEIDMVTILAIDPGWGGQKFAPATFDRVARARELVAKAGRPILVCLDGGVTKDNIAEIAGAGADLAVTGSAVFDGKDAEANARFMMAAMRDGRPGEGGHAF